MFADARLMLPRWSLSSCVRAYVGRSTLGRELSPVQRLSYFPATPLCGITWFVQGQVYRLPFEERPCVGHSVPHGAERFPRVLFGGPCSGPTLSYGTGEVQAFMLVLMPDALRLLTGVDPVDHLNRFNDAHQVLPRDWHGMLADVLNAASDEARVQLIDAFLEPRWRAVRGGEGRASRLPTRLIHDWAQGLAVRAATSGLGRSLRQSERRIKEWTGQSLRQLRGLARGERTFLESADLLRAGVEVDWAEVATSSGYADQSHLCRESRRITGFTPTELQRRVLEDESAWVYRIWGA